MGKRVVESHRSEKEAGQNPEISKTKEINKE